MKFCDISKEMYVFENNKLKHHRATGTRWTTHKIMTLNNFLINTGFMFNLLITLL